jgi:flagellar biosynthesis protein FlhA
MQQAEKMMKSNLLPVLLCPGTAAARACPVRARMPHLRVLSMAEIPHNMELKSYGVVSF